MDSPSGRTQLERAGKGGLFAHSLCPKNMGLCDDYPRHWMLCRHFSPCQTFWRCAAPTRPREHPRLQAEMEVHPPRRPNSVAWSPPPPGGRPRQALPPQDAFPLPELHPRPSCRHLPHRTLHLGLSAAILLLGFAHGFDRPPLLISRGGSRINPAPFSPTRCVSGGAQRICFC